MCGRHGRQSALSLAALSLAALVLAGLLLPRLLLADRPADEVQSFVSVSFYADASCILTLDGNARVGLTSIETDKPIGGADTLTLIRCETAEGVQLHLLSRGDERSGPVGKPLLGRDRADSEEKGYLAWLCRADLTVGHEPVTRHYLAQGRIAIRGFPAVEVDGAALHSSQPAFARLDGFLESPGERNHAGHSACTN